MEEVDGRDRGMTRWHAETRWRLSVKTCLKSMRPGCESLWGITS
jgi:hypothetical protein